MIMRRTVRKKNQTQAEKYVAIILSVFCATWILVTLIQSRTHSILFSCFPSCSCPLFFFPHKQSISVTNDLSINPSTLETECIGHPWVQPFHTLLLILEGSDNMKFWNFLTQTLERSKRIEMRIKKKCRSEKFLDFKILFHGSLFIKERKDYSCLHYNSDSTVPATTNPSLHESKYQDLTFLSFK